MRILGGWWLVGVKDEAKRERNRGKNETGGGKMRERSKAAEVGGGGGKRGGVTTTGFHYAAS